LSFEARDLAIKLSVDEAGNEAPWLACPGCDSTGAPKPGCHPPSAPCKPPSHPCVAQSKKAETFDSGVAGLLALRQQLQSALSPNV